MNLLYDSGYLNWGFHDDLGGWDQVGGGREAQEEKDIYICTYLWLIHVDVWERAIQYCKEIILQVKINKFLKNVVMDSISSLTPTNRSSRRKYTLTLNDRVNQIDTLFTHTHTHTHTHKHVPLKCTRNILHNRSEDMQQKTSQ